jgi:hypothetical protein
MRIRDLFTLCRGYVLYLDSGETTELISYSSYSCRNGMEQRKLESLFQIASP